MADAMEVELHIVQDGAGTDRLDVLGNRLRTVLDTAGFTGARPLTAVPPDSGKTDLGMVFGALVVSLQPEALQLCVEAVRRWVERRSVHRVMVRIGGDRLEIDGRVSRADLQRLIDAFLARHGADGGRTES